MDTDVLVIGAGPAGAAAGIAAARAGVSVVVLDRARFPRDKTCGDAISNRGVELYRQLGALDAILAGPHARVTTARAILPSGATISRDYPESGLIVPRQVLDDALKDALCQSAAVVREGVSVKAVRASEHACEVDTSAGQLRARVAIAADGPGSVAWPALGHRAPKAKALAVARTAYLKHVDPSGADETSEHYFERFLPAGYAWSFPAVAGVSNVGVYQRADTYGQGSVHLKALLQTFLDAHPERFSRAEQVGPARTWPLPIARLRLPPSGAGLLCAGDAACLVDPFTGEGIWHALASGMLAGRHAAGAVDRGGLTLAAALRYRVELTRCVAAPAAARRLLQFGMDRIVGSGADKLRMTQTLLRLGYRGGLLEVAKRV
ncbi:MAG TPA: geranylgeranyl reductase family protein [Polyangiaceae bacterium]|nr:geranylgeranyl reductase family protein [Polyangiaceae bacterium]